MSAELDSSEERVERLHAGGIVDLHFDMLMDLYEKRDRTGVLAADYLDELRAGGIGVVAAAIYIEDRYLPEMALRVGVDQIARLYREVDQTPDFAICKTCEEIVRARQNSQIALLITMEGAEPLGSDLDLLRVFYELGVRAIGLTHARRNAAGSGGIFAASGSPLDGLTAFGRDLVRECESLGVIVDLAHINPAGFEEILGLTTKPPIVSHTNARKFYDVERNMNDEQIKMIGQRHGVIGINSILVSPRAEESTLDRYVDHIEHVVDLIGIDGVGIGFDFFEFIYEQWPEVKKKELGATLATPHFIPELRNHSHARNVTRKLIARGFKDDEIEKIVRENWMRILREWLPANDSASRKRDAVGN